jgi:type II secretion system protein L
MPPTSTTLRVFVDVPPDASRSAPWTLFDAAGQAIHSGRGRPAEWPDAERKEAVIAAAHGRIATLELPTMPPGRAEAAARYALEDQLAEASDDSHIALASQRADGMLRVAIVGKAWMEAFVDASRRCDIDWDRALLESDLAEVTPGSWRWCAASVAQSGFVRTDRGATIAVGPALKQEPPAELALALARSDKGAPRGVRVEADGADAALLSRARSATGVAFTAGSPWRWAAAKPTAYADAIDLLSHRFGAQPRAASSAMARMFRPALWIAGIALALHVVATLGQWGWLRWHAFAAERDLGTIARTAVPEYAGGGAADASPALALARRERDLEHRAGLPARDDFVPLLGRAAPVLASLPRGALRSLSYGDGHLLLDLAKIEPQESSRLQGDLQRSGLVAIVAPTQTGARLRIGWD